MRKKKSEELIKKLVKKLKLDEKTVGLLVYSKGSIKEAGFEERVKSSVAH